ncbi:5'-flap endonuclease [Curvularia kusanoi]|uniref:Structure-specific endonuclease subunit SLX4 n=1 Tax=Curvularia kusanoi TaxID=90978 RepID=A0A9P4W894_CURKU|nr:5'-flap endonuclease [Curvularia kusanoi]
MPTSSPFALSPPSSPQKHTGSALASGSRAVPIPEKASRGFATVSSLVRSEHFAQQQNEGLTAMQQGRRRTGPHDAIEKGDVPAKKPASRAASNAAAVDDAKPKPKPRGRKPKADKEAENRKTLDPELRLPRSTRSPFFEHAEAPTIVKEPAADAPKLTKAGKPRKPRVKKADLGNLEAEPKPRKARTTKAKAAELAQGRADAVPMTEREEATVQPSIPAESIREVPQSPTSARRASEQQLSASPSKGLDLEEAVSRRRDWTPPRDTVAQSPSTLSTGKENRPLPAEFTNLVSNFTYESPTAKASNNPPPSDAAKLKVTSATKRRRAELAELPGVQTVARALSPEKGKAPKKKARTITDLVTGQYAQKDVTSDQGSVTSDFFSPRTTTSKVPLNDVSTSNAEAPTKKLAHKRSKSRDGSENTTPKAKPRAKKASTKAAPKPKPVAEKLLSPTSAVTRMNRQEILFGTSSQLALEESPTTVRQIQQAMRESERDDAAAHSHLLQSPSRWPRLQRVEGRRGLWRESTRDSDGGLLRDTENVYIPEPDRTQDIPLLMDVAREDSSVLPDFVDIDDLRPLTPTAPIAISSDLPTPPESQSQKRTDGPAVTQPGPDEVFDDIDDFGSGLPPSNQNAESQNSFVDIDEFESTHTKFTNQVPSSDPTLPAPPSVATASQPAKRRGRPPKTMSAIPAVSVSTSEVARQLPKTPPKGCCRFIDIEEILDSEEEVLEAFSPSPPRMRSLQDSPPLPLTFNIDSSASGQQQKAASIATPIFRILESHLEWVNIRPSICSAITTHIRSVPPTKNPKKPSWHEKILMYDPIILEDFTAYLNTNTKLRTYKRATQKQIKVYNAERKMRGNSILGVEREDQVLAIERDLEVYMVRDWCQEMSICCIHAKESRGRGSARKGFY